MDKVLGYFKFGYATIEGKDYYGLFTSVNEDFECNKESFRSGWEVEKMTPEIKEKMEKDLRNDVKGWIEVK